MAIKQECSLKLFIQNKPELHMNYGFGVGDKVCHIKGGEPGIVTEIDSDCDLGGVTTCRVIWGAKSSDDVTAIPRENQDIQWTNKLILADTELDFLRKDLVHQLNIPDELDWDYFLETAKRAKVAADREGRNMISIENATSSK